MSKKTEKVNVEEVKEEIKDEVKEEIKNEVVEEVKVNWFNKTKKWFKDHKNEVVAFAAGAATGTGLTVMLMAGQVKEELDSNDDEIIVEVEEVTVEDEE